MTSHPIPENAGHWWQRPQAAPCPTPDQGAPVTTAPDSSANTRPHNTTRSNT